ncbi:MAG TPA: response regulator, partial [Bacteroidota bacterium]
MTASSTPLSILHLEDNIGDALLIAYQIKADLPDCRIEHVETSASFLTALGRGGVDLILSDYRMPGYDGDEALKAAKAALPDVPFIMVTGELGEDRAIETVKRGATDYVLKDNLKRLVPLIRRALEEAAVLRQRKEAEAELHRTVEELRKATQELQRQAEELRVQQERLRFHVENSPLAVVEWSADFIVTRWSREAERLFGWKSADIIGKRI